MESGCFDYVIVSTDDEEIASVAKEYGAIVPFMRPAELSDDYTGTLPVIRHAVEWYSEHQAPVEYACCLYATAPFVRAEDIRQGLDAIQQKTCSYVFAVASYASPIQRAIRMTENGRVAMFSPEHVNTRSQDLEEAWHDAGQFYWGTAQAWREERLVYSDDAIPLKLPRYRVQDIDTFEDWQHAEALFQLLKKEPL